MPSARILFLLIIRTAASPVAADFAEIPMFNIEQRESFRVLCSGIIER